MTLPPAAADRQLKHRRRFDVHVYARGNGLWEVDATLSDLKTREVVLGGAPRPAGQPVHEMLLRLLVDEQCNIVAAGSESTWMPYPGICNDHEDAYGRLVGLNLLNGFRRALLERVGGAVGCTHITELAQVLPTAVIQAFADEVIDTRGDVGSDKPFQFDRYHALKSDGEVVRLHYPRWYRPPTTDPARTPE